MASLTRWVLAHKRTVVITWIVLTIAGIAAAGPATDALESEFSVPGKESWETNVAIAQQYGGDRNGTAPLIPVVTLPKGETVESPGVRAELTRLDRRLDDALPGARIASYPSTGDRTFVSDDGRTVFALVSPRPDPDSAFGENPKAEKAASAALKDVTIAGQPVHLTGFDALAEDSGGDGNGPGVFLEALLGGLGALLVLTFVFASLLAFVPLFMAFVSIMTTFLLLLGLTEITSRLADRAVPDRADRPRCRDRLLADRRLALARGARAWAQRRRGHPEGDGDGRPRGRVQRHHRRDRPAGADRAAAAVPALDGLRRHADPARLDARGAHAAAGGHGQARPAARLAAQAHRRQGEPRVDALGGDGLATPVDRRGGRHGGDPGARVRRHRPPARDLRRRHDGEVRRREGRTRRAREVRHRRGGAAAP